MSTESFLPEDYEAPVSSAYTSLEIGENRVRIISNSMLGWIGWINEKGDDGKDRLKPIRVKNDEKEKFAGMTLKDPVRHFWVFLVWNYRTKQIEILEVTQKGIQSGIMNLYKSEDWGDPKLYDIIIFKEVKSDKTTYSVQGSPKSQADYNLILSSFNSRPCMPEKLYESKDPWELTDVEKEIVTKRFSEVFSDLPF